MPELKKYKLTIAEDGEDSVLLNLTEEQHKLLSDICDYFNNSKVAYTPSLWIEEV